MRQKARGHSSSHRSNLVCASISVSTCTWKWRWMSSHIGCEYYLGGQPKPYLDGTMFRRDSAVATVFQNVGRQLFGCGRNITIITLSLKKDKERRNRLWHNIVDVMYLINNHIMLDFEMSLFYYNIVAIVPSSTTTSSSSSSQHRRWTEHTTTSQNDDVACWCPKMLGFPVRVDR